MPLLWMLVGCLGEFGLAFAGLVLFMRWRERGLSIRLASRIEDSRGLLRKELVALRLEMGDLRNLSEAPGRCAPEPTRQPVLATTHTDVRSAVLDLHRRGRQAHWIASTLGIPRADVTMMILVSDGPNAGAKRAAHAS
jgi:hypothetical protein